MAWETRNGKRYYYRKQRIGNKVVSRYVGTGILAEIAESEIEANAQLRETVRELENEWELLECAMKNRQEAISQLLLAVGLHRQNWGPWRVKRK